MPSKIEHFEFPDLPKGWARTTMGEVAQVVGGGTPESKDPSNFCASGGHAWLTPADLSGHVSTYVSRGKRNLTAKGLRESSAKLMPAGTVLMSSRAPIGYVAVTTDEISTNQGFKNFVCSEGIKPEFVLFWLRFIRPFLEQMGSGSTFAEISGSRARDIPLHLSPVSEQQRIVAKIEALFGRVNAAQDELSKVPAILKRFRQSVLSAACSGRLTADLRSESDEGGGLPSDWRWRQVEELVPLGGIFDGPFGSNLKTSDYTATGVRVIRMENIGWLRFIESKQAFISEDKYDTLSRHTVRAGDVIFSSFIGNEIRSCVLPILETKAIAKADCFCLRPDPNIVDRYYFVLQLSSHESYDALREQIHGATRPRVNTTQLRKLLVRVCQLREQHEIVRRVEALFNLADMIEKRVRAATTRAEKLTQSILAKAFRGELVPQDPEDESATVLLERVRVDREAAKEVSSLRPRGGREKMPQKAEVHMLTRGDIHPTHLTDILRQHGQLTAEALWSLSQLDIDQFYDQLKDEESHGLLKENRSNSPGTARTLEAA
jgi:type I restriction enzyme S subunit